ncbi:LysE family translocator [Corynebacterium lujinxingii]|uniref:LysE family translocator n=1 Tax=Corynebacterium lujinxingii TaxID=2763010 RepID=UPI002E2A00C7|nr:LysE family translocator [Corynebacterium lujinxingii]
MISPGDLAVIVGLNVLGAAAPGPDVVLVTRTATRSRRHGWATALGIQTGVLMWCTLTVFGAAALLNAFPHVLTYIQIVGGAILIAMGASNVRSGVEERHYPPTSLAEAEERLGSVRASYLKGLATNLANPKIVVALSAMIAPLLPPSPSLGTAAVVIVALWLSAFALFAVFVQVVSTDRVRRKFLRAGPYIDIGAGAFFVVVGITLIVRGALTL